MRIVEDIVGEESIVTELRRRLKNIKSQRQTISCQFRNRLIRNDAPRRIIVRREKRRLISRITASELKIKSLRDSLLGVEDGCWLCN